MRLEVLLVRHQGDMIDVARTDLDHMLHEARHYQRHFAIRDRCYASLWQDVGNPRPGWLYLWGDWQEWSLV